MLLPCILFLLAMLLTFCIITKEWIFAAISAVILILLLLCYIRRLYIIYKVRGMTICEKCKVIKNLCDPLGYCYVESQDIFSTTLHAWQRAFGYGSIYDAMASHVQMVLDTLPIYFDYDNRTWLIELWKGQYGINTGAEIGIYCADTIIPPEKYDHHIFHAVSDDELLNLSLDLKRSGSTIAKLHCRHWWLTAFCMGLYSNPGELCLNVNISFPHADMMQAFAKSLAAHPQAPKKMYAMGSSIAFAFDSCPTCNYRFLKRFHMRFTQRKNRLLCKLFLFATKPFKTSLDRVLYLYFFAPFIFRRIFALHSYRKSKHMLKRTPKTR